MTPKLLTVHDLAAILRCSPNSIRVNLSRAPHTLPPRIDLGIRRVLWREDVVTDWLMNRPAAQ